MTNAKDNLVGTKRCNAAKEEVTAWQKVCALDAREMGAVSCDPVSQLRLRHAMLIPQLSDRGTDDSSTEGKGRVYPSTIRSGKRKFVVGDTEQVEAVAAFSVRTDELSQATMQTEGNVTEGKFSVVQIGAR